MLQRPTSILLSALLLSLPLPGLAQHEVEDEAGLDADELIVEERADVEEDGTVVIEETISYVEDDEDSEPVTPGAAPQAAPNRSPGGKSDVVFVTRDQLPAQLEPPYAVRPHPFCLDIRH